MKVCTILDYIQPRLIAAEDPGVHPTVELPPLFLAYFEARTHDHYGDGQCSASMPALCAYRFDAVENHITKGFGIWAFAIPLSYQNRYPNNFGERRFFPASDLILV